MTKWVTAAAVSIFIACVGLGANVHAQQVASGLSIPFTTTATGQAGVVTVSGVFRIAQFVEQNGAVFAVGTLAVGNGDPAAPRILVSQLLVPVLVARSATSSAALTFQGASATAGSIPGTPVGVSATNNTQAGTTAAQVGAATAASAALSAGVPSSAVPGQQANCGPLHMELGPLDLTQSGVAFHLDRLVLDIGAPQGSVTTLNAMVCSTEAALAAAVGATPPGAAASATPTFGVNTTAGRAGSNVATATPLQSLVAALNQMFSAF